MARTSTSRGFTARSGRMATLAAAIMAVLSLGLAGCLMSNDHPAESGGTITVDIRGLKQQMGSGFTTQGAGQAGTDATTAVESLVIGAVVITFTDEPLTSDTNVTSDIEDKLADDIINSINYFTIVDLPTAEDFVEFKVPPPGSGHWLVAAVGTKKKIVTFDDLGESDVSIYYGFDGVFHDTSGNSGPTVEIEMKRACFIDEPPKGCAAYSDGRKAVVTPNVEIISVKNKDGADLGYGGPVIVNSEATKNDAKAALDAIAGSNTQLTVTVTHRDAPGQTTACKTSSSAVQLAANCPTATFVTDY